MLGKITGNSNSQDSPQPRLGGSHYLPPYSIFCASPRGPHPNGILSRDSQVRVPKLPNLGLPRLWGPITFCANLRLIWSLKKSYSSHWELFNDIRNVSIQWVLTPKIALWGFKSPLGLQLPKWEFPWECEGSFPHTFLHSREHEMWLPGFPLGPHSCKPLPWLWAQG